MAQAFGVAAESVAVADDMSAALGRARAINREGNAYLIDAKIMQQGKGANDNWHPDISIADLRTRKV